MLDAVSGMIFYLGNKKVISYLAACTLSL